MSLPQRKQAQPQGTMSSHAVLKRTRTRTHTDAWESERAAVAAVETDKMDLWEVLCVMDPLNEMFDI